MALEGNTVTDRPGKPLPFPNRLEGPL